MLLTGEPVQSVLAPEEPFGDEWTGWKLALCIALFAIGTGIVVFLVLVVAPSAGAAGGCGGG